MAHGVVSKPPQTYTRYKFLAKCYILGKDKDFEKNMQQHIITTKVYF